MTILSASEIDPAPNLSALLAFFVCLGGIYMLGQGLRAWRRRKSSGFASATKISNAKSGIAELEGVAEGPHTMSAALSGKDCYFYRTIIWRQEPDNSDAWKKAAEETFCLPFFLTDNSGRILVDPRSATLDLPRDIYDEYGKTLLTTHTDIPERLENFLARHEIAAKSAIRVEEFLIAPATSIYASGAIKANKEGFNLTPTPLNRIEGGYLPMLKSVLPALDAQLPDTLAPRSSSADREKQASQSGPPANGAYSDNGTHSKTTPTERQSSATQPEVIRLSLSSPALDESRTMQSRLAAALRRANVESTETWGMALPETHAVGTAAIATTVVETATMEVPTLPAPVVQALPEPSREPVPAFILCKGTNGSGLTLSWQVQPVSGGSSALAVILLILGPLLTLASTYYLLLNSGWLSRY